MPGCFYSCLAVLDCEEPVDCCHACLYFDGEVCTSPPRSGYFPRRFSRLLIH